MNIKYTFILLLHLVTYVWSDSACLHSHVLSLRKDFNRCYSTLPVQTHVNMWDPILCAHQDTCSAFKLA
jgi:hypothetical protein